MTQIIGPHLQSIGLVRFQPVPSECWCSRSRHAQKSTPPNIHQRDNLRVSVGSAALLLLPPRRHGVGAPPSPALLPCRRSRQVAWNRSGSLTEPLPRFPNTAWPQRRLYPRKAPLQKAESTCDRVLSTAESPPAGNSWDCRKNP